MLRIKVVKKGRLLNVGVKKVIEEAIFKTVKETADVAEKAAKKRYLEQRKTGKMPSKIIGSFKIDKMADGSPYRATVFAGGPRSNAPYTIWVDEGHNIKNKSNKLSGHFKGYKFMATGAEVAADKFGDILAKNIAQISK